MTNNSKINGYKGILFMLLASLFFAINDALVKYVVKQLGSDYSLFNVVFVRAIFTSILILLSIFLFGKFDFKKLFNDKRSYTRGFFETAAARWVIGHSTAPNNYFAISEGSDVAVFGRIFR